MSESDLSKKVTKAIKTADRLVRNIKRNTADLVEAFKELKEFGKKGDNEEAETK